MTVQENPRHHAQEAELEEREVRVRDPGLSERANTRLTEELRAVIGSERVLVPRSRPHPSLGERPARSGLRAFFFEHRMLVGVTFAVAVVIGAIVSLTTGSWWFLPLVAGLHAIGTTLIAVMAVQMTTTIERPDPTLVALLQEEGIRKPEEHFSRLVAEFAPPSAPSADAVEGSAAEVVSLGGNRRTVPAFEQPALAAMEQRSAMTPTSGPSYPAGQGSMPALMNWLLVLGVALVSIIIPPLTTGGWLWLLPAVLVPMAMGWTAMQLLLARREGDREPTVRSPILTRAVVAVSAAGVVIFCVIVAVAMAH
jgi:hypothetical protein